MIEPLPSVGKALVASPALRKKERQRRREGNLGRERKLLKVRTRLPRVFVTQN